MSHLRQHPIFECRCLLCFRHTPGPSTCPTCTCSPSSRPTSCSPESTHPRSLTALPMAPSNRHGPPRQLPRNQVSLLRATPTRGPHPTGRRIKRCRGNSIRRQDPARRVRSVPCCHHTRRTPTPVFPTEAFFKLFQSTQH